MMTTPNSKAMAEWPSQWLPDGMGKRFVISSSIAIHLGGRLHEAGRGRRQAVQAGRN